MVDRWHGYLAVEDIDLTDEQRAAILAAFRELGPGSDPQPARLLHSRTALDGSKAIFSANFNEDNLTVEKVKQFLADAVGTDPGNIDDATQQTAYGPLVTYSVVAVDKIRFLVFESVGSTWNESRLRVLAYLYDNAAEWGEDVA
jgi:hypothetical protein